jgi:hypothetical protein
MPRDKLASFRRLGLFLLLSLSFCAGAQTADNADSRNWTPGDQDLRILEIRVKQYTLDDVIAAYQFEDIVLLPLGALSELLDIAIDVGPEVASGFVFSEDRGFYLDTSRREVTLEGVIKPYDPDKVHVLFDDIYVESNLLGDWLGITFDVDLFSARVWVRSAQPLPFEQRLEREKRIALSLSRVRPDDEYYPRHYEPYQNWSMPFVDQTLRSDWRKTESGETINTYQYTTYATADVAKLEAALYFSGNDEDQADEFRLTLGRKDPEGGLLGFMQANEYAFGHVVEPRLALINQPSTLEPGVTASNFPLGQQSEYDRHRFIGVLLPGWEVELYRNNALIGYRPGPVDGQYDFQDVPLLFGNNYFRLVFYGPQGQIREEEYRFDLNQSLTRAGEHYYRITSSEDEIDGSRTLLQYDAGLHKHLSTSFNLVSIPLEDTLERKQHDYLSAGLRSYWESLFVTVDFIDDTESGDAAEIGLQTRLGSTIFRLTDTWLNEFFSEEFRPTEVELSRRSNLRIDTAIPPGFLPRIPVTFEFERDEFADGGDRTELSNIISVNARGFAVSNRLVRQETSGLDPISTGTLQLSTHYSRMSLRGTINYELDPDREIDSVVLTADPGQFRRYRLSLGLNHTVEQDLTEASISANKASGRYNLSLGARYNSDDEITLNASLSFALGHEPRRQQWYTDARALAANGSVSARAFLDGNQDGIYNEGDEPIADVGFRLNGGYSALRTDEDGIGFLTGLPAHQPLNLSVAPETVVDPLWTIALDGVRVVPRPGHAMQLDFPIFLSGEIDGTVYVAKDGKEFGAGRVIVELLDTEGSVIKTASTAYDGFYVMSKIPLGQYRLRVSTRQQADLGLVADKVETFAISADELFVNGLDFVLRESTP